MCGIFGAIGTKFSRGTIRALALINRQRGEDSLGFFDSLGRIIKRADDPVKLLGNDKFDAFLSNASKGAWFIGGHTRFATYGKVTNKNSHPFKYGSIIGAHNGMVDVPTDRDYNVDSEYLFDQLFRHKGNYQTALADVDGYWGLSWTDGKYFYLQAHNHYLSLGRGPAGIWYYSSDYSHLLAAVGKLSNAVTLRDGDTVRFTKGKDSYDVLPSFVGQPRKAKPIRPETKYRADVWRGTTERFYEPKKSKLSTADEERLYASIDPFDLDCADAMATEQGYASLVDYMAQNGIKSYSEACDMLESGEILTNISREDLLY
jgi:hypothetical protein